jgi:hypothetical protein
MEPGRWCWIWECESGEERELAKSLRMKEISREIFDQQRRPRFGTANPERMNLAFWEWMIQGDESAPLDGESGLAKMGWRLRDGKLKSSYGPYRARDRFHLPLNREEGPIWTFDRMGATQTELPDGRLVCVGGEHEDFCDPDFCIYNDVVVFSESGLFEIYGYPKGVFPPTDFHTAALVGDQIVLVGCLGYKYERSFGHTPVYRLDLSSYRITELETSGEMPGWIFKHSAEVHSEDTIVVRGGEVIKEYNGEQRYRRNFEDFNLDLNSGVWRRLTDRKWREFSICPADKKAFGLKRRPSPRALLPSGVEYSVAPTDEWNCSRIVIGGVPVSVFVDLFNVKVIVEGELPSDFTDRVAEEIRAKTDAAVQRRCVVEEL